MSAEICLTIRDAYLALTDSESAYDLNLETSTVEDCIEWAKYLAVRVMDMDKELADEADNFREFGKWLKYGTWHSKRIPHSVSKPFAFQKYRGRLFMIPTNSPKPRPRNTTSQLQLHIWICWRTTRPRLPVASWSTQKGWQASGRPRSFRTTPKHSVPCPICWRI